MEPIAADPSATQEALSQPGDGENCYAAESPTTSNLDAHALMQASFDKVVSQEFNTPFRYLNVAVLIIRWAEHLDRHLKCGEEISELQQLFVTGFGYKCRVLTLDDQRSAQLQLNYGISSFVIDNDGPCRTNLLIVYYTGHGIDSGENGLDIGGVREPGHSPVSPHYEARANWNEAEKNLRHAEADILTILDTCSAGSVMKGIGSNARVFEVLVAAGRKAPTAGPGERSFSRALIDSLKEQLKVNDGLPFTTFDLNQAIMRKRNNQSSHNFPRFATHSDRFIRLAPLNENYSVNASIKSSELSHLTLRFVLESNGTLSAEEAKTLTTLLSRAALEARVGVQTIEWVNFRCKRAGERFVEFATLFRTVSKAKRRLRASIQENGLKRGQDDAGVGGEDDETLKRPCISSNGVLENQREGHEFAVY